MDEWNVRHYRHAPSQRVVDLALTRGVGQVVVAANDVSHAHVVVIDNHSKHVSRRAVGAQEHEVVEVLILPYDASLHLILDDGLAGRRRFEPDYRLHSAGSL